MGWRKATRDDFWTTRTPETKCPECDARLDAATGYDPHTRPGPGDFTVCAYCVTPLRYDDDLILRRMTSQDWADMDDDTHEKIKDAMRMLDKVNDTMHRKGL